LGDEVLHFIEDILKPYIVEAKETGVLFPVMQVWSVLDEPFVSWMVTEKGAVVMPISEAGSNYVKTITPQLERMGIQPFFVELK
jgi:hypothetical protein